MENYFTSKMAVKSTEELEQKIASREDYAKEAILACLLELKKRDELSDDYTALLNKLERHEIEKKTKIIEKERSKKKEAKETAKLYLDFLTFKLPVKIVPSIFYLCIIIYIAMLLSGIDPTEPSPYDLLAWGGNLTQLSFSEQPWRLVTHIFLHGSIFHILMNMAIFCYIGTFVEFAIGKKWFMITFLTTGIGGGIASAIWNLNIVSVGASGAIFGLFGLTLSLLLTSKDKDLRKSFIPGILIFLGYNVINGLTESGIDNAAHFGGLGTGIVLGFILGLTHFKNKPLLASMTSASPLSTKQPTGK